MPHASTAQLLAHDALAQLLSIASENKSALSYAGDVTPQESYDYLRANKGVLIDVRTLAEWQFTGMPDLNDTPSRVLAISWKTYPDFALNPAFGGQLTADVSDKSTPLFFLCRSGGRSLDAAVASTVAGYRYCFNIAGGFEGEPDIRAHRGTTQSWKASQLPWKQG